MNENLFPADYKCAGCGISGCKLWRLHGDLNPVLKCIGCVARSTFDVAAVSSVAEDGTHFDPSAGRRTDQIGGFVPAVPNPAGGFYPYPHSANYLYGDWRRLPLRN